jgi:pimeloyl-ACP methyl ester carboxylesterase
MEDSLMTRTVSLNGIDLHVEVAGEGEPLVLLHGFTGCGRDWRHVFDLEELARRHRVIVPDLRGHGRSTDGEGAFTHARCADDVAALLDVLGVGRFRALGLSLGGNVLLHLATREPARVDAMAIVSSPPYFPEQARAIMRLATWEAQPDSEKERLRTTHARGEEQARRLLAHARGFAADVDDMSFTPPRLGKIEARTLVVWGDRDPLYPVELGVELWRGIRGAELCVVPGGGHGPVFAGTGREVVRGWAG